MKTETKHTPGPWQLGKPFYNLSTVNWRQTISKGTEILAQVHQLTGDDGLEELEANSAFIFDACANYERVLAQRDELAAAITGILDGWDDWANEGKIEKALEQARAVLAKLETEAK